MAKEKDKDLPCGCGAPSTVLCKTCEPTKPVKPETCNPDKPQMTCKDKTPCNAKYDCDCVVRIGTDCIHYQGPDLNQVNIFHGDILTDVIIKMRSYVENTKAYLENKLSIFNVGTGIPVYRGESLLGFKEFKTLVGTGEVKLSQRNNDAEVVIHVPEQKGYKVQSVAEGNHIYKETVVQGNSYTFVFKGIHDTGTVKVRSNGTDIFLDIDKAYLDSVIEEHTSKIISDINNRFEQLEETINNKIENIDQSVNIKIEQANEEFDQRITTIENLIRDLGIVELRNDVDNLKKLTSFIKKGLVVIWNNPVGTIPQGWKECTDLRGRIPVGISDAGGQFGLMGAIGGKNRITLSIGQMPKHGHAWGYGLSRDDKSSGGSDPEFTTTKGHIPSLGEIYYDQGGGGHKSYFKNPIQAEGNGDAIDIMNPYRVVQFIEYVG